MTYRQGQIITFSLRALWWMVSAATGHCQSREVFQLLPGHQEREFTPEEKLSSAMDIANRHIQFVQECVEEEFAEKLPTE
jgi:hypothetical protein